MDGEWVRVGWIMRENQCG